VEWFPLKYAESFYSSAVKGKYFSLVATFEWEGREVFAGLICITDEANDDAPVPPDVRSAYILTLGVVDGYRRRGLARELLRRSIEHYEEDKTVKLVYLHVIPYNIAAIRLYERYGFERLQELSDFYRIGQTMYDAYLYGYYINGGQPPLAYRLRRSFQSGFGAITSLARSAFRCRPPEPDEDDK
jgi:RimJ/RimL family protein N-acetyltransferase